MERVYLLSLILAGGLVAAQLLTLLTALWAVGNIYLKQNSETSALIADDGPEIHAFSPSLSAPKLDGEIFRSDYYLGREWVLLFSELGCEPCTQVLQSINAIRRELRRPILFVVVTNGNAARTKQYLDPLSLDAIVLPDERLIVRNQFGIGRVPYALLIDAEGVVRMKGVINNREQLESVIYRRGKFIGRIQWHKDEPHPQDAVGSSLS